MPDIFEGSLFYDNRGSLCSFNDFDMNEVRRMYSIAPASTEVIRAWQAHRLEKKWFLCTKGAFEVKVIKIENFEKPSQQLKEVNYLLTAVSPEVLHIPGGYANGFRATEPDSHLIVFSNYTLAESRIDDYRFEQNFWDVWRD